MVAHSTLTGANLHEPKGAASASSGQVYVADGSGSGTWKKIGTAEVDTSSVPSANEFYLTVQLADISTSSKVYAVVPHAATLSNISSVLGGALTDADATLSVANHAGTVAQTLVVAFTSSAEGDVDTAAVTTNNTFTAGQRVSVATDGGSTGTQPVYITLTFTKTA